MINNETQNSSEIAYKMACDALNKLFQQNIGFFSAEKGAFDKEIWTRDTAIGAFGLASDPRYVQTISTIMDFQRTDGEIPHRIEHKKHSTALILGWLTKIKIDIVSRKKPFPVFVDTLGATPAIDTVPALIIACGKIFRSSEEGQILIQKNYHKLVLALKTLQIKIDLSDNLVKGKLLQDWLDCINRPGKLAFVNILHLKAIDEISRVAKKIGNLDDFKMFSDLSTKVKESFIKTFWDEKRGYFKASDKDTRLDIPANLLATIYLKDPQTGKQILATIKKANIEQQGLIKAFDRPYSLKDINWRVKAVGMTKYGHIYLYPWIGSLGILAKLSIASTTNDTDYKKMLINESSRSLESIAKTHLKNGGFYEIIDDKSFEPAIHRIARIPIFKSSYNFFGSISTFIAAYQELQKIKKTI